MAGARSAVGAVDRREQHVADLGPLERQRAAAAARAQPDGDARTPRPRRASAGPSARTWSTWLGA